MQLTQADSLGWDDGAPLAICDAWLPNSRFPEGMTARKARATTGLALVVSHISKARCGAPCENDRKTSKGEGKCNNRVGFCGSHTSDKNKGVARVGHPDLRSGRRKQMPRQGLLR